MRSTMQRYESTLYAGSQDEYQTTIANPLAAKGPGEGPNRLKVANPLDELQEGDSRAPSDLDNNRSRKTSGPSKSSAPLVSSPLVSLDSLQGGLWGEMNKHHSQAVRTDFDRDMMESLSLHLRTADEYEAKFVQKGLYGKSLGVLGPENKMRVICYEVVEHRVFGSSILVLIFINTIILAVQAPTNDLSPSTISALEAFDVGITIAFTAEMFMRVLAVGFYRGERTYLKDSWNVLDFVVVISSWLTLIIERYGAAYEVDVSTFRALRAARPLRQLRALRFANETKVILKTLGKATRILLPVCYLLFIIFVIATIMGVPMFQGMLSRQCAPASGGEPATDSSSSSSGLGSAIIDAIVPAACPVSITCSVGIDTCTTRLGRWSTADLNLGHDVNSLIDPLGFDNAGQAMASIWMAMSLDGNAMEAPERLSQVDSAVGWVVWPFYTIMLMIITCCIVHIFGAVITSVFEQVSRDDSVRTESERKLKILKAGMGKGLMTLLTTAEKVTTKVGPSTNEDAAWKIKSKAMLASAYFQNGIMGVIVFNVIVMAMEYDGMSPDYERMLYNLNNFCTVIFTMELIAKVSTFGFYRYISQPINVFDAFIVLGSLIGWIYAEANGANVGRLVRTFRLFRAARIARIMLRTETVRALMAAVLSSTAPLFNLFLLTLFSLVLFAIFGMHLFHKSDENPNDFPTRNYSSFSEAVLAVFHNIMQADWTVIMLHYVEKQGWGVAAYFVVVMAFCKYVLMNLYMACLMNNYAMKENEKLRRQKTHLTDYSQVLFDDFGIGNSLRGSMGSDVGSDPEDEDQMEQQEAAGISGELLVETSKRQWAPRWFEVKGNHFIMYNRKLGMGDAGLICNIPLSHCALGPPKTARPNAPYAFRVDVTVEQGTIGANISKFVIDPGSRERSQAWLQCMAFNRLEGTEMHRRRALVGVMHKLLSRQNDIIEYVQGRVEKRNVLTANDQEVEMTTFEEADKRIKQSFEARANMRAFAKFQDPSFFDIIVRKSINDTVLAPVSLFCLDVDNPFRSACVKIAESKPFEIITVAVILSSMLVLAIEGPESRVHSDSMRTVYTVLEVIFLLLFWLECMIKVVAMSFFRHQYSYIADNWNKLDFLTIVLGTIEAFLGSTAALGRSLRSMRMLRALRLVRRAKGLQMALNVLGHSAKDMAIVMFLQFIFFLIFGIFGMDLWMGQFKRCHAPEATDGLGDLVILERKRLARELEYTYLNVTGKVDCLEHGGIWENPVGLSFDNMPNALYTLFVFALTTDRSRVFVAGLDSVGKGLQPSTTANYEAMYFFLGFQLIVVMFFMNLFVVVMIRNLHNLHGSSLLTNDQLQWATVKRRVRAHMKRTGNLRSMAITGHPQIYRMVTDPRFASMISSLILMNMVFNALEHFPSVVWMRDWAEVLNFMFLLIFSAEALAKISSYGLSGYMSQRWDQFDATIIGLSWVFLLLPLLADAMEADERHTYASISRALRGMRGLRLLRPRGVLAVVVATLIQGFRNVLNVTSVLMFNLFIFTLIGMFAFGDLEFGEHYNELNNFANFQNGATFLIKVTFAQHYVHVQHEVGVWMLLYLLVFQATTYLLVLNLYICVIYEAFDLTWSAPSKNTVTPEHISGTTEAWRAEVVKLGWYETLPARLQRKVQLVAHEVPLPLGAVPNVLRRLVELNGICDPASKLEGVMKLEVRKQTETTDSVWEPRFFRAEAGRLFMFLAPQGYETESVPEEAECIFSLPCEHIEVSLPTWKRNNAPDAFKLHFFEREIDPANAMKDTSLVWQDGLPQRMLISPVEEDRHISRDVQLEWMEYIERGRRSFFVWLQSIQQNLELDIYARKYSAAHTAILHAGSDDEDEDQDEAKLLQKAQDQAILAGELELDDDGAPLSPTFDDDDVGKVRKAELNTSLRRVDSFDVQDSPKAGGRTPRESVRATAKKHAVAVMKGKVAEARSRLEFGGDVVAYEQLALTVHLHYIGRQAMTLHSRVERDSFMLLLLANKLLSTMVRAWLAKRRAREHPPGPRTVTIDGDDLELSSERTHVWAVHCAAWWRAGMLISQRRSTRYAALISDPTVVTSIETMIDENALSQRGGGTESPKHHQGSPKHADSAAD